MSNQLMNRTEPLAGITSAGQPDAAALEALAVEGYKLVVDLRGAHEDRGIDERAVVESLGMRYVSLPIPDASAICCENADALHEVLEASDGPVLVHCGGGIRVGALLALREGRNGRSIAEAIAVGEACGGLAPDLIAWVRVQLEQD